MTLLQSPEVHNPVNMREKRTGETEISTLPALPWLRLDMTQKKGRPFQFYDKVSDCAKTKKNGFQLFCTGREATLVRRYCILGWREGIIFLGYQHC